jgi:3D (Asp-Asp-Asp) domain-containing protein
MAVRIYGLSLAALLIAGLPHPTPEPHPTASSALEGTTLTSEPIPTTTLVTFADEPEVAMVGDLAESEALPEVAIDVVLLGDDREPVTVAEPATPAPRARSAGVFTVSAYAPGCGDSGRTRTGTIPTHGTVAVDPRVIPLGSRLVIEGIAGVARAEDTGGAVLGRHIDRWVATCSEARQWGVRRLEVSVLNG